jgi:hypothetical protein
MILAAQKCLRRGYSATLGMTWCITRRLLPIRRFKMLTFGSASVRISHQSHHRSTAFDWQGPVPNSAGLWVCTNAQSLTNKSNGERTPAE